MCDPKHEIYYLLSLIINIILFETFETRVIIRNRVLSFKDFIFVSNPVSNGFRFFDSRQPVLRPENGGGTMLFLPIC